MGRINAKIVSIENGFDLMEGLTAIKIVSKKYNILIMEDYLPVIGKVEGSLSFVGDGINKTIENVEGFYKHSHNEFELLIKSFNRNDW